MKLIQFKGVKVHGYLNFNIKFDSNLTFLVGINGAGKTTALKLILGLINPSYDYLNQIYYEVIELICLTDSKKKVSIKAEKQDESSIKLSFIDSDKKEDVFHIFDKCEYDRSSELIRERLNQERQLFDKSNIAAHIRRLDTPIFLGLDRRISEIRRMDVIQMQEHFHTRRYNKIPINSAIDRSLIDVQEMVFDYYRSIANEQPKISEQFKNKIFSTTFKFIDSDKNDINNIAKSVERLSRYKSDIIEAAASLNVIEINNQINEFFQKMDEIVNVMQRFNKGKSLKITPENLKDLDFIDAITKWSVNSPQLQRIENIITYSQEYQNQINKLQQPVRNLEGLVSNFFKEAKKELTVQGNGEIKVKLPQIKEPSSIFELSSGEKQIIIMIAHLIFYENRGKPGIFIIDEPELSLHIAWQEIFVDSIQEASPNTQFILATHSPSIIAKAEREKLCQDLTNND